MALILALNPGNSHSPTLSRLARELHGCELIGAESCVVAIKAIKERVPDVVLLPAKPARGEADLIAHLKTVPGGVLTLKLPPVESADPLDLARQIREMLTGTPASADAVPRASARQAPTQACLWARRRTCSRRQPQPSPGFAPDAHSGSKSDTTMPFPSLVAQWTGVSPSESDEPYEPYEPLEPSESDDPYATDDTTILNPRLQPRDDRFKRGCRARPLSRPSSASRAPWCPTGRRFEADSAARSTKSTHQARSHQQPM